MKWRTPEFMGEIKTDVQVITKMKIKRSGKTDRQIDRCRDSLVSVVTKLLDVRQRNYGLIRGFQTMHAGLKLTQSHIQWARRTISTF